MCVDGPETLHRLRLADRENASQGCQPFSMLTTGVCLIIASLGPTVVSAIGSIPCWYQDKAQYYAINQDSYVPIPELDHERFFSLAQDMAKQRAGSIEIRKPKIENTIVSCRMLPLSENPHNHRLIKRLIRGFNRVSEVQSITSFWPDVRICSNIPLLGRYSFDHELKGIAPTCTHLLMLMGPKRNEKHPLFVSDLQTLKGKRKLIEVFYSNIMARIQVAKEDLTFQILEAQAFRASADQTYCHLRFKYQPVKLNLPLVMDMYLTSSLADFTFNFGISPGRAGMQLLYHREKLPKTYVEILQPFIYSLMIAAEPFLNMDFSENFNVHEAMVNVSMMELFSPIDTRTNGDDAGDVTLLQVYLLNDLNQERLLYIYLSLASGPFYDSIRDLIIQKASHGILMRFFVSNKRYLGILKFFTRVSVVLAGTNSAKLTCPPEYYDQMKAFFDSSILSFVKTANEKFLFKADVFKCTQVEDLGLTAFELLVKYGMVKCDLGDEDVFILHNRDRTFLGLPVQTDSSGYSYLRRTKYAKKSIESRKSEYSIKSADSTSSPSDEEGDEISAESLEDSYNFYAKHVMKARIHNAYNIIKLEAIKEQCLECERLLIQQRKLVIYELFLKIKQLMAQHVGPTSSVGSELRKPNSILRSKLKQMKIPEIELSLQKAMELLEDGRLEIAKPKYRGETLHWVTSEDLRSAFITLLPFYQPEKYHVPEKTSVPELEFEPAPGNLSFSHVLAKREEWEAAEETLKETESRLDMALRESRGCLDACRNREILVVGAVFQRFIEDLKILAPGKDIIIEAENMNSSVRLKMESVGITSVSLLKKIFTFVLTHRNSVAHPAVEPLPNDDIARKINPEMRQHFTKLLGSYSVLQEKFSIE